MKTRAKRFVELTLFCVFFIPFWAQAMMINNDLKVGSTGPEVKLLQTLLNRNINTRVANFGPGSPGQETDYFGRKTLLAVRKFQQLNQISQEIFKAGFQTRVKLEGIFATNTKVTISSVKSSSAQTPVIKSSSLSSNLTTNNALTDFYGLAPYFPPVSSSLKLYSISPNVGGENQRVIIKGAFPKGTFKILTTFETLENISSSDGQTISITLSGPIISQKNELPQSTTTVFSLPLWISALDGTGASNGISFNMTFN